MFIYKRYTETKLKLSLQPYLHFPNEYNIMYNKYMFKHVQQSTLLLYKQFDLQSVTGTNMTFNL